MGAPPASSQGSPIPLASDTVVPEEIDETVTAPPLHEDALCHWERGKKGRAETGISRRFSTALWVPFGIVFGVPASPSKKRMENEGSILAYGPSTRVSAVGTWVCREILKI